MNIDIPDAPAVRDVALDEPQYFVALGHLRGRQILEQFKDRRFERLENPDWQGEGWRARWALCDQLIALKVLAEDL